MPFYTKHFGIPFFTRGDNYSASIDQSRFKQIDEELNSLSSIIGSGVISGLNVEQYSSNEFIVRSGSFCINGKIYNHPIDEIVYFESSEPAYVYVNSGSSQDVIYGYKSNVKSIEYIDVSANLPVSSVDFETVSPYHVNILLNENLPVDYSRVIIYRSLNDDVNSAVELGTIFNPSIKYEDVSIISGNVYYYWFKIEDVNGIMSEFSDSFVYTAIEDMSTPAPPSDVKIYPAHRSLGITWKKSLSNNVAYYYLRYSHQGQNFDSFIPRDKSSYIIKNLTNGYPVNVSIRAVSFFFIESADIQVASVSIFNPGARDVDDISVRFLSADESGGVTSIQLEWINPVIDPNLPDLSIGEIDELSGNYDVVTKYIIWEIRQTGSVSIESVPTVASNDQVAIINSFQYLNGQNQLVLQSLKDNSSYLIKLYRIINGREGVGRYIYVTTGDITPPSVPSSISASLLDNGILNFSWLNENPLDVYKQEIKIKQARINSITYDYTSAASVLLKFRNRLTGPLAQTTSLAYALFVDNYPIKIGVSGSYLIFEIDESRVLAGASAGASFGLNLIESVNIISPPEGVYLNFSGLTLSQLRTRIELLGSFLEIKWQPGSGRGVSYLNFIDFIDIQNTSGTSDNELQMSAILEAEPKFPVPDLSASELPDAVIFYGLNSGFSINDIEKYVSLGSVELLKTEFIGQSSFYNVPPNLLKPSYRYYITISVFDFANNKSVESSYYYDTPAIWQVPPPAPPIRQVAFIENEIIKIAWSPSSSSFVSGYKILRAELSSDVELDIDESNALVWKHIATTSRSEYEYVDYAAAYGKYYVYRITSIGILGRTSPSFYGLDENGETSAVIKVGEIANQSSLIELNLTQSNNDIIVEISNRDSNNDGYVIYRSFNFGVYKQVATISSSAINYIDKNVLVYSGNYSYVARPVSSESFIVTNAEELDNVGILLAKVSKIDPENIDVENLSTSAFLLSSYLLSEMEQKVNSHRHLFYDNVYDFRINLDSDYIFSNFETDNNQRFYVLDEVPNLPDGYETIVLLNGQVSSIPYTFNLQRKILKFNSRLAPLDGEELSAEPFEVLPEIKIIIDAGGETVNNLPAERLNSIFAQQIGAGKMPESMIPTLFHSGIKGESIRPLDCICESLDGFKFLVTLNENKNYLVFNSSTNQYAEISEYEYNEIDSNVQASRKVGFPLNKTRNYIIYDAINIPGTENFVFATNKGVLYYYQEGGVFRLKTIIASEPPADSGPCHKIKYFPDIKAILCISFRCFDIIKIFSNGDAVLTRAHLGFNFNCHVFRDAVHLYDGIFYVTSDIGLFKVELPPQDWTADRNSSSSASSESSQVEAIVTQLGFVSGRTTDIYAIWKSVDNLKIYISTEIGIFESSNQGFTFSRIEEFKNMPKLWSVINYQGTLFAVSDNAVWRKREDESYFVEIYKNNNLNFRKFIIKYGRMIFTTNDGIYRTDSILYAKYYNSIKLYPINILNSDNGRRKIVYSVVEFGPYMVACMEGKTMVMYSLDRYADHVDFTRDITQFGFDDYPSVYVNDKPVDIGVYYQYSPSNLSNDCIFFDFYVPETSSVKVIRQYSKFYLPSGGWARRDFGASCFLYKNNVLLNDGSRAEKQVNQIAYYSDLVHSLDDTVSDLPGLELGLVDLKNHAMFVMTNKVNLDGAPIEFGIHKFTRNNIRLLIDKIDIVNSKIYDQDDAAGMGILSSLRVPYPNLVVDFIANVLPSPYGVNLATLNGLGINYQVYSVPNFEGTLGTYDPEDSTYYLPPLPLGERLDGVDEPNYAYEDDDNIDIGLDIPYSGFYGRLTDRDSSALGGVGGRNTPGDGTIDDPGGSIGGGSSGGGGMAS